MTERKRIPLGVENTPARHRPAGWASVVNIRPEVIAGSGKGDLSLYRLEGVRVVVAASVFDELAPLAMNTAWYDGATIRTVDVRGARKMNEDLYVLLGETLYRVKGGDLSVSIVGTGIVGTGRCWLEHNGTQLVVLNSYGQAWVYTPIAQTFVAVSDPDFMPASWVQFFDQFMVFGKRGSQQFFISNLGDATAYDALDVASSEALPDNLVSGLRNHRDLILAGEELTELWYNGGGEFPFVRAPDGVIEVGCAAAHSLRSMDNTPIWLAREKGGLSIRRLEGRTPRRISTSSMDDWLDSLPRVYDATADAWQFAGHSYYAITFPAVGITAVYDAATGLWHRRRSANADAWRVGTVEPFQGKPHAVDVLTGALGALDASVDTEFGAPMPWETTSPALDTRRRVARFHRFELEVDPGRTPTGQTPAALALSWSDNDGKTWSSELFRSMGAAGEDNAILEWVQLGASRNGRMFRVRGASAAPTCLIGAHVDVGIGR